MAGCLRDLVEAVRVHLSEWVFARMIGVRAGQDELEKL
jgi:poly-beta-hydroxyalkanoate depolymerase